jgi:D-inositol-3-phosphate glycosyltransferase
LNDLYMLKNYAKAWTPLREKNIKLVVYAPLDGVIGPAKDHDPAYIKDWFWPDDLVLYNQWAMQEVGTAIEKFRTQHSKEALSIPRLHAIPHGVDRKVFYPPADSAAPCLPAGRQKKLKQELFDIPGAAETIFILNANRYNERKDIETTIAAFAKALPHFQRPACLVLHTPNTDPRLKVNLEKAIAESGCGSSILLNPLGEDYSNDETLRKLYQACSIGINTSLGEGWGGSHGTGRIMERGGHTCSQSRTGTTTHQSFRDVCK